MKQHLQHLGPFCFLSLVLVFLVGCQSITCILSSCPNAQQNDSTGGTPHLQATIVALQATQTALVQPTTSISRPITTSPVILRPTGNFPSTSVDHAYGNCIGVEVQPHHDPTLDVDWNPDADYQINGQPVAMQEWSNAKPGAQNQPLYKVYLPNGFVDGSGHKIVFPSGGGMIVVFAKGCESAAKQWYDADSTPNGVTADQLVSIGNAREV